MALTPAEKQRRYRERKEKNAQARAHLTNSFLKRPFEDFINDVWFSEIMIDFDLLGIEKPPFEFPAKGNLDPFWKEEFGEGPNRGAVGAAERMVGVLASAASDLASRINQYKREEIDARITEIEASDLTDPVTKKQAFADVSKLTKYREELSKSIRWNFPQWRIQGE
jgi:hypothetical protein